MGCNYSDLNKVSADAIKQSSRDILNLIEIYNNEKFSFTSEEINLIQKSFTLLEPKNLGIDVMARIFSNHKEIRDKWIFASYLETDEEVRNNAQLNYHATKIMEIFQNTADNLQGNFNIKNSSNLVKLGRNHFTYGVKVHHFQHFEEALMYCLEKNINDKEIFNEKMKAAWHKLFWSITAKICEGIYKAETDETNKKKKSSTSASFSIRQPTTES